jgi:hypothetical protein
LLWQFVETCMRGRLPIAECSPVYQMAVIAACLFGAVIALIVLLRRRAPAR